MLNFKEYNWTKEDIENLQEFLKMNAASEDKIIRDKKLLNTKLPVLGISYPILRKISKEIYKGNYIKFLDLMLNKYHENTIINGFIINNIDDFKLKKKYLDIYASKSDNWATCDVLKFNIDNSEENYLKLSKDYLKSNNPFTRRIGIIILFSFTNKEDKYLNEIFNMINGLKEETHYYVNMVVAWFLCELFITKRDKTLKYLKKHNLNNFTINKTIQKCRESLRISKEDKEMLLNFKVKN